MPKTRFIGIRLTEMDKRNLDIVLAGAGLTIQEVLERSVKEIIKNGVRGLKGR